MKAIALTAALLVLASCTTVEIENPQYRAGSDQYGYQSTTKITKCRVLIGSSQCWFPTHDSYTTSEQATHNAELRAEEKRQQRAYERALREAKKAD